MTSTQKAQMFDWKKIWPSFLWDILSDVMHQIMYHIIELKVQRLYDG
jgi:hypothetical protein